ncbi:MAG: TetR family transcriptional regulator [Amycolatopsis sp.]|uniref:TetR/AcrR family transcriptional regulator n=1 Tax=Amycolatopsis sp. TaxID=37632 RepID=UPI00262804DD|nr:TetR/AcrR family transcriptional regulator [Amycolatopsis sp.]MCU1684710.1 TetR family transcriptional regulator [Amycolatopsis sp.]
MTEDIRPTGFDRDSGKDRALLEATVAVLREKGYGGLTTAEVAKRAGVSTATLYRRWRSKEDLVVGTAARWAYDLEPAKDTGSLRGDLDALLRDKLATLTGLGGHLIRALMGEAAHNRALGHALNTVFIQPLESRLSTIVDWAVERREIPTIENLGPVVDLVVGSAVSAAFFTNRADPAATDLLPLLLRALGA